MPAKLGLGLARKAKQREAATLAEAIAAGMVQAKGRSKKARAEKGGWLAWLVWSAVPFLRCAGVVECVGLVSWVRSHLGDCQLLVLIPPRANHT